MSLSRKAIIIGNNIGYKASAFLKGVDRDLVNYNFYLKSDIGGAWQQSEIKILHNRGRSEVLSAIRNCIADYSFVVFSGHGFISSRDGLTYLCVNNNFIDETELDTGLKKQTLLLDCCREVSFGLGESFEKGDVIQKQLLARRILNPRRKFDNALELSSNGQFTGYACEVDETSGDNSIMGGVYSSALLKMGKEFGSKDQPKRNWLPIRVAHNNASTSISNNPFTTQTPSHLVIPETMKLTHPFAVSNLKKNLW